jgi:hypothetical protein
MPSVRDMVSNSPVMQLSSLKEPDVSFFNLRSSTTTKVDTKRKSVIRRNTKFNTQANKGKSPNKCFDAKRGSMMIPKSKMDFQREEERKKAGSKMKKTVMYSDQVSEAESPIVRHNKTPSM